MLLASFFVIELRNMTKPAVEAEKVYARVAFGPQVSKVAEE